MAALPPYEPPRQLPERAFHVARMVLPPACRPVHPDDRLRVDMTTVKVPGPIDPHLPLVRGGLLLPNDDRKMPIIAPGPAGLEIPWGHHPNTPALLIPGPAVEEVREQNRWLASCYVSPLAVDLPFTSDALASAAWNAIANIRPIKAAIAELAYLITQVDALGHASERERSFVDQMRLSELVGRKVRAELAPNRPLLDARCLRWILTEMCVALASGRPVRRPPLNAEARDVTRTLLPLLGRSQLPVRREFYRALWLLHDTFSPGSTASDEPDARSLLTMVAAHSAGVRFYEDHDDLVLRSAEMWATADDDRYIAGRDVTPSVIRDLFRSSAGLPVSTFLVLALLESYAMRTSHADMPDTVEAFRRAQAQVATRDEYLRFISTARRQMSLGPQRLGRRVLAEMERYGRVYRGWGSVPQHASEALRDRPLMEVGQGLIPLGQQLFLGRAAELPAVIYGRRSDLRRKEVRGRVGHLFEARLQRRLDTLRQNRSWVATEDEIDAVVPHGARRPDAIIGSSSRCYLVIEINYSRLETGVAAGNAASVDKLVETYIKKRKQADALIANARTIIGALLHVDWTPVRKAVPLVVADEPLPPNPALEQAVRARQPDWNPRFVCSVAEFELLLDLAEAGWDVPQLVERWQDSGGGQMLGTFIRSHADMTPRRRDTADRLRDLLEDRAA